MRSRSCGAGERYAKEQWGEREARIRSASSLFEDAELGADTANREVPTQHIQQLFKRPSLMRTVLEEQSQQLRYPARNEAGFDITGER